MFFLFFSKQDCWEDRTTQHFLGKLVVRQKQGITTVTHTLLNSAALLTAADYSLHEGKVACENKTGSRTQKVAFGFRLCFFSCVPDVVS